MPEDTDAGTSIPPPKRMPARKSAGHKAARAASERRKQEQPPKLPEATVDATSVDPLDYYDPDLDLAQVTGSYQLWEELQELLGVKTPAQVLVKVRSLKEKVLLLQQAVEEADPEHEQSRPLADQQAAICTWIERGAPMHLASALSYVEPDIAESWRQTDRHFAMQVLRAKGMRQLRLQAKMAVARAGEWQKFATFLERQFSEDWSVRRQQELSITHNYVLKDEATQMLKFVLQCINEEATQLVANRIVQRIQQARKDGSLLGIAAPEVTQALDAEFVAEDDDAD